MCVCVIWVGSFCARRKKKQEMGEQWASTYRWRLGASPLVMSSVEIGGASFSYPARRCRASILMTSMELRFSPSPALRWISDGRCSPSPKIRLLWRWKRFIHSSAVHRLGMQSWSCNVHSRSRWLKVDLINLVAVSQLGTDAWKTDNLIYLPYILLRQQWYPYSTVTFHPKQNPHRRISPCHNFLYFGPSSPCTAALTNYFDTSPDRFRPTHTPRHRFRRVPAEAAWWHRSGRRKANAWSIQQVASSLAMRCSEERYTPRSEKGMWKPWLMRAHPRSLTPILPISRNIVSRLG